MASSEVSRLSEESRRNPADWEMRLVLADAWEEEGEEGEASYQREVARQLRDGIDSMTRGYLETAIWSSTTEDGEPLEDYCGVNSLSPEAIAQAIEDCVSFLSQVREEGIDESVMDYEQWGHDFWLTRNRHGAGFWDRGFGEVGRKLTEMCHQYGERYLYVGDDDKVYMQ